MKYTTCALLQLLIEEYNELNKADNTIMQAQSTHQIKDESESDDSDGELDEDEIEDARNPLEEDILMIGYTNLRKRRSSATDQSERSKRSRPTSYGDRRLYFVDPEK